MSAIMISAPQSTEKKEAAVILIDPSCIRTDLGTQARCGLDEEIVKEYAEAMEAGANFPAILVFHDESNGSYYIPADGFHRLAAHIQVKPTEPIRAEVRFGSVEDARWESIGSNKTHGLHRTNEDKRRAVKLALLHPNGTGMSDSAIAKHVGVHHVTVGRIRHELESTCALHKSETRIGQDGRTINTENIGSDKNRRHRGRSAHQYRRLKDCITIHLPDNNPELFAVELRNGFSSDYLGSCIASLQRLLLDKGD